MGNSQHFSSLSSAAEGAAAQSHSVDLIPDVESASVFVTHVHVETWLSHFARLWRNRPIRGL